jgi:parallel beta-helix repeat protein
MKTSRLSGTREKKMNQMSWRQEVGARRSAIVFMLLVAVFGAGEGSASTILGVPQDYPTIQAAIDAAVDSDTVLVSPGTYVELIDFLGKQITVESASGPDVTIIDGNLSGTVVHIIAGADQTPVLRGFTIRNGYGIASAGGIEAYGGPALIEGNRVTGNFSCSGGGIAASFSSATIQDNVVSGNRPNCSGGPGGGGILIGGAGTAKILNNMITDNVADTGGGGISLFAAGSPTISGNVISNNASGGGAGGSGGGMELGNASNALITNNLIFGNSAFEGGGISWLVPDGETGPRVVNNTIANNEAILGSAVFADGFDATATLANNIFVGSGSSTVLECGNFNDLNPPIIVFNDVFNGGPSPLYGGICTDQTGVNGNISADPMFINPSTLDFHLKSGSPAVDVGTNTGAPASDIDGDSRPLDGNGDGIAVVDMGADEVSGGDTTPPTITCNATPSILWPPNHKLTPITVQVTASDDSGSLTVSLASVTSSQPANNLDAEDLQGWRIGSDDRNGLLRAERFRQTRTYTLMYEAEDPAGNAATCQTTVTVPQSHFAYSN